MGGPLFASEFEVFGKVQGVFFRKNTEEKAKSLGVRGWCRNTKTGTVKGVMEGNEKQLEDMRYWLKAVGSPMSKIEKAEFTKNKSIDKFSFEDFTIDRSKH